MTKKTVLITGCSSGFGYSLVANFLQAGWKVIATLRNAEQRKTLFSDFSQENLHVLNLDVTQESDRDAARVFIELQCENRLDCLVNNAGFGLMGALECVSEVEIQEQMAVNFFGTVFLTRLLLPALRNAHGKIFMLSSVFGFLAAPLTSPYCASKFALEGFSEALCYELQPHHVQVCLIEPANHHSSFGKNMVLNPTQHATYQQQTQNYLRFRDALNTNPHDNSDKIAKMIVNLTNKKNLPLRVRSGKNAHLVYFAKRLLPIKIYGWILGKVYRAVFLK